MPVIELSTVICAPRERVFDLARSIDAHQDSTGATEERAVAGVTCGLIGLNDEVTWEARHLGVRQRLTVRVTAFARPKHFQDVMISGAFKRMVHLEHGDWVDFPVPECQAWAALFAKVITITALATLPLWAGIVATAQI